MGLCTMSRGLTAYCGGEGGGGESGGTMVVGNTDTSDPDGVFVFPKVELVSGEYSNVLFDVLEPQDDDPARIRVSVFYI